LQFSLSLKLYKTLKQIFMKKVVALLSLTLFLSVNIYSQKDNPKATEVWEPEPKVITPGSTSQEAPSDAIVLFNGKDLSNWVDGKQNPAKWSVENGVITVEKGAGDIQTKQAFGSCQLHVEWRSPAEAINSGQDRGNSGIFFMGRYEVQVLDSYKNRTYSNGQAGSIYKQYIPLVNACRPPGEWQTYDIVFTAPQFNADSTLASPARLTVLQNGVLVQNNVELKGGTVYIGQPTYKKHNDKEYLKLQEHGCAVSYRNIWIREL
jgi:Domain of Unknown Function (DUF1080)